MPGSVGGNPDRAGPGADRARRRRVPDGLPGLRGAPERSPGASPRVRRGRRAPVRRGRGTAPAVWGPRRGARRCADGARGGAWVFRGSGRGARGRRPPRREVPGGRLRLPGAAGAFGQPARGPARPPGARSGRADMEWGGGSPVNGASPASQRRRGGPGSRASSGREAGRFCLGGEGASVSVPRAPTTIPGRGLGPRGRELAPTSRPDPSGPSTPELLEGPLGQLAKRRCGAS